MVSFDELVSRVKKYFSFNSYELTSLAVVILVTGFIFSFRNWGTDEFNILVGVKNFLVITLAAAIGIFAHLAPQKIYALSVGYKAEFRVSWAGIVIMLVLTFLTAGHLALIFPGTFFLSVITRHRLGQFRYGYLQEDQSYTGSWGLYGSLIMAGLFRIGDYFIPGNLFLEKGLMICIIYAICAALPFPKNDGLQTFFGARGNYYLGVVVVVISSLLLLYGGGIGLIVAWSYGLISGGLAMLWGSEV